MATMKAWAYFRYGGSIHDYKLVDAKKPEITNPNDVLVRNHAISLNPTDDKQRSGLYGHSGEKTEPQIGGRDASGVIEAVGSGVKGFKAGDEVWYAGDTTRPGSFAQFTLVDHRIISHKPKSLSHEDSAALPLTSLTVWEAVKENMNPQAGKHILVTAGAGGVGSIAIQLAKVWGLKVTATASRKETIDWVKSLGADYVIDHKKPFREQVTALNIDGKGDKFEYDYCMNAWESELLKEISPVVKPKGQISMILPIIHEQVPMSTMWQLFMRSQTVHFEIMFARSMFQTEDIQKQSEILQQVADLADAGKIKTTKHDRFEWSEMVKAQELLVSGKNYGKIVLKVD